MLTFNGSAAHYNKLMIIAQVAGLVELSLSSNSLSPSFSFIVSLFLSSAAHSNLPTSRICIYSLHCIALCGKSVGRDMSSLRTWCGVGHPVVKLKQCIMTSSGVEEEKILQCSL